MRFLRKEERYSSKTTFSSITTGICLSLHHPSAPEALIERIKFVTMKFSAILFTTLFATASAFAPATSGKAAFTARYVATDPEVSTGPSTDPVDKTLTGIDDAAEHDVFDPHAGNNPALTRNNNDEVWVPQVRACDMRYECSINLQFFACNISFCIDL